jgi:hypothetical protein
LPDWSSELPRDLEYRLNQVDGIHFAQASSLTGNVLIHFDPERMSTDRLLTMLSTLQMLGQGEEGRSNAVNSWSAQRIPPRSSGSDLVVRAAVRGVLGHAAVDLLFYGATVSAYALGWTWVGGLGVIHLFLDVVAWGTALRPIAEELKLRHG